MIVFNNRALIGVPKTGTQFVGTALRMATGRSPSYPFGVHSPWRDTSFPTAVIWREERDWLGSLWRFLHPRPATFSSECLALRFVCARVQRFDDERAFVAWGTAAEIHAAVYAEMVAGGDVEFLDFADLADEVGRWFGLSAHQQSTLRAMPRINATRSEQQYGNP